MLVERTTRKRVAESDTLRIIVGGAVVALVVSIGVAVVSRLLGHPAHPGLAGAIAAACATSCFGRERKD
jgi:hypothetical protein